jgi:hypothetical protein
MSYFTMFSNLATEHGESNHLFLPRVPMAGPQDDLVRVLSRTDPYLHSTADQNLLVTHHELRRRLTATPGPASRTSGVALRTAWRWPLTTHPWSTRPRCRGSCSTSGLSPPRAGQGASVSRSRSGRRRQWNVQGRAGLQSPVGDVGPETLRDAQARMPAANRHAWPSPPLRAASSHRAWSAGNGCGSAPW